ncbi:MAG: hypothetical protein AAFN41_00305 [Planctomycetota bacterium]
MIAVIDSWGERRPPPGAADDDDLLLATGADAAVMIGDATGLKRARAMGINVIEHIGVTPGPRAMLRRRVLRRLPADSSWFPMSIWAAGITNRSLRVPDSPDTPHAVVDRVQAPFVLPVASDPRDIDAFQLVLAAGLLEAAGSSCVIGLPSGASNMSRARRLLSNADRLIPVIALPAPAPRYIVRADLLLDLRVTLGGPIDELCQTNGVCRVDARTAIAATSLAVAIRQGLSKGVLA